MEKKSTLAILMILTPLVLSISLSMDIYVPSLPSIIHYFHTNQQAVQWTLSIYMFGVGAGQLIMGPIADALGRRRVVLWGILIYLLGTVVAMLAPSIGLLITGRLLQSLGTCAALVVAYAVVRDLYDSNTSAKIYSFLNATTALAPIIAPLLGGYLQNWFGTWRASFVFLFLFAALSLLNTYLFLGETHPTEKRLPINFSELCQRYRRILGNKDFLRNTFMATAGLVTLFVFCSISSYLLIERLHFSAPQYGLAFGSNALTYIIASLLSARLVHLIGSQKTIRLGTVILLIGSFLMLAINFFSGLSFIHFMLPMWLLTLSAGLMMGPAVALGLEKFPDVAGTASALITSSQFLFAGLFGTLLMLKSATSAIPFALLMLAFGLIAIVWAFAQRKSY